MDYGHWDIQAVGEFEPSDWFGFIYRIQHTGTGRAYIGKKIFTKKVWRQVNKKKKSHRAESDWRLYHSSSEELKTEIAQSESGQYCFVILRLCSGKAEWSYLEEQYQYTLNVLFARLPDGTKAYYNKTIGHRHFAGVEKQMGITVDKMSSRQTATPQ